MHKYMDLKSIEKYNYNKQTNFESWTVSYAL